MERKKSILRLMTSILIVTAAASVCAAQQGGPGPMRSSAAYAEVLLRSTEVKAELEALAPDYTETSPRMVDLRTELNALSSAMERILAVRPSDTAKLTNALGKLLVRKASLDADLIKLTRNYTPDHVEVKRARKKVDIFDSAIKEILR